MTELRDKINSKLDELKSIGTKEKDIDCCACDVFQLAIQAQVDLLEYLRIKVMKFKGTSDIERMLYDEIQELEKQLL